MKKSKRILLTIGSTIALTTLPIMAMSCEWLDKLINKNNPNPTPTPGPDSGLVNPNPSNPTPAPAPVPTPEVKPEEKEGYVTYKSTNEDYLKKNNTYYFSKLSYNPVELSDEVYNSQEWKLYRPKMWFSLTNKPENETETESKLEKQLDKWHMSLDNVHFTNDCESACGIWNIIRKLAESDEKKEGINQGGRFKPKDNESYNEALMRFLKEMDDYLDPDYAFRGLTEKSRIDDVNQNPDLISKKLIYSADSKMPSTFIREEFNKKSFASIAETEQDPFVKELISGYENAMYNGWTMENKAKNWFVAPFSFGSNPTMRNKFPQETFDMYTDKNGLDKTTPTPAYNNYNPVAFNFLVMERFDLSEGLNFKVYKNLIQWLKSFNNINSENKSKWSEIESDKKYQLKNASTNLVKALVEFIDWHHLLLGEFEDPNDRHSTLADLFAMKSLTMGDKIDFDYTYRFAYKFLYEKLVPTMVANGWKMPDEFKNLESNMLDRSSKDSYIYDYIFKYINVIFKAKYPNIDEIKKPNGFLDVNNKEHWQKLFLDNVLKKWNSAFNINVDLKEF
ncbi:CDS14 family ICE transfer lipoprotein [Metamycoplasma hominis]|uniref:CDS14 family ICE transfer lipoprotein n=1 Tax=Metamycoplasma hominis TaxID=2098 RepID=UPI003CEDB2C1